MKDQRTERSGREKKVGERGERKRARGGKMQRNKGRERQGKKGEGGEKERAGIAESGRRRMQSGREE